MNSMITAVVKGILWTPEYYLRLGQVMLKNGPIEGFNKAREVAEVVVEGAMGDPEIALAYQQYWEKLWSEHRYLDLLNNVGSLVLTLQERQMDRIRFLAKED